ncbi:MAG TPA: thioredoxin family protein [Paludibacter sp.]|nr:thioredoxin family protein [Paludibacter sp.]
MKRLYGIFVLFLMISAKVLAQNPANVQIVELNAAAFKQKVWNFDKDKTFKRVGNTPLILDFHATWCRPCKMLAPHLQTIQNKYKGKLTVYKIDVDQEPQIAQRFNVEGMPTLVFIPGKTAWKSEVGYREYNDLEKLVKAYFFAK